MDVEQADALIVLGTSLQDILGLVGGLGEAKCTPSFDK